MKKIIKRVLRVSKKPQARSPIQAVIAEEPIQRARALTNADIKERMQRIDEDFLHAFALMKKHPNTVSFFGSSAISPRSPYCAQTRALARKIVEELGLTIVSGGGPGIMEAANHGAKDAKGDSVGMAIELPHEQETNRYVTHSADFYYFFSRKVALTFTARAYIFMPGGFGTLDELFEILTLKKNAKIPPLPVILVGADFWRPLIKFMEQTLYKELHVINETDIKGMYVQEDDPDKIIKIIAEDPREPTVMSRRVVKQ